MRVIDTGIKNKRFRELLNHLSVQLSDGYWENEEGYFEEYWNWLDFKDYNDSLQIIVRSKPTWDYCLDIFSRMSDIEIVHYVANTLDSCYDDASGVFTEYIDIIDEVISTLLSYPQAMGSKIEEDDNSSTKPCPFCGSDKLDISVSSGNNCYYKQVYCKECHTYGPRYRKANEYGTQDYTSRYNFEHDLDSDIKTIKLWNNRLERVKV